MLYGLFDNLYRINVLISGCLTHPSTDGGLNEDISAGISGILKTTPNTNPTLVSASTIRFSPPRQNAKKRGYIDYNRTKAARIGSRSRANYGKLAHLPQQQGKGGCPTRRYANFCVILLSLHSFYKSYYLMNT